MMTKIVDSQFSETSEYLKDLLRAKYLRSDAKSDVEYMLKLHSSGEYCLDRYSPIVLVYPFLMNPKSPAGMVLRSLLAGYTGDLFQKLATEHYGHCYWLYEGEYESALPYPFEHDAIERAAEYLEEPLSSGDLLTALLISPMDPDIAPADSERDGEVYEFLRSRQSLPPGMINEVFSEIAFFLSRRKVDLSALAMRLRGYAQPDFDPNNIVARYSLAIGLHEGYLKVQIIERWGKHDFAEREDMMSSPHGLWLPESVLFLPEEIEEFEALLNSVPPVPEEAYQEFFEAHPKWLFLLGEQYEETRPQVRLPPLRIIPELALVDAPVDTMWLKPDFLLKRIGLDIWDILDIKASDRRMVVGKSARRKFSASVAEAVAQLREYSRRLRQNEVRAYVKRQYGLTVSEPAAMVLVGRDFDFKTLQEKSMFSASEGVKVYTYDHLHRLAKHRAIAFERQSCFQ